MVLDERRMVGETNKRICTVASRSRTSYDQYDSVFCADIPTVLLHHVSSFLDTQTYAMLLRVCRYTNIQIAVANAHPAALIVDMKKLVNAILVSLLRLRPRRLTYMSAACSYLDSPDESLLNQLITAGVGTAVRVLHVHLYSPDSLGALAGFVATRNLLIRVQHSMGYSYAPFQVALGAMPRLTHLSAPSSFPFLLLAPHMTVLQSLHADGNHTLLASEIVALGHLPLVALDAHIRFEERSISALVTDPAFPRLHTIRFSLESPLSPDLIVATMPLFTNLTHITLRTKKCTEAVSILIRLKSHLVSLTLKPTSMSLPFNLISDEVLVTIATCRMLTRLELDFVILSEYSLCILSPLELRHLSFGMLDGNGLRRLSMFPTLEHLSVTVIEHWSSTTTTMPFEFPPLPNLRSLHYQTRHTRHDDSWCMQLASTFAKRYPRLPLSRLVVKRGPLVLTDVSGRIDQHPRHVFGFTVDVKA
jgi:hypothetical protein